MASAADIFVIPDSPFIDVLSFEGGWGGPLWKGAPHLKREDWVRYLRLISMGALLTLHLTAAAERPPHDAEDRMGVCCRLQSTIRMVLIVKDWHVIKT